MPSLNTSSSSSSVDLGPLLKLAGLIGLISCGIGYVVYQYVRLNPAPTAPQMEARAPNNNKSDRRLAAFEKLGLTDDQRKQLSSATVGTTDPRALQRAANKILNPEQKAQAKMLMKEAAAARQQRKAEQQAKLEKLFPGDQLARAKDLNKQIHQETQERRRAAAAAKPAGN